MSRKTKQAKSLEELLEEALVPEEEQPYEVPENWVWVRLGSVDSSKGSRTIDPKKYPDEMFELYSVPSFPESPEIVFGSDIGSSKQIVHENDILLCKINPRINRVWKVEERKRYRQLASTEWIVLTPSKNVFPKYLLWVTRSPFFRNRLTANVSGVGGSLTRARPKQVITYGVPLPPLPEQKRIVNRVEFLLGKIDEAKQLIEEARESFEQRRAAILARAFRGELTRSWREQNPDVEPADRLLERIREEKAKSETSKRERKKNVDLTPIDPPYELPEGWTWVRLGDLISLISGQHISTKDYNEDGIGIPYITGPIDFSNKYCSISKWTKKPKVMAKKGDILVTVKGSGVGKVNILDEHVTAIGRQLMAVRCFEGFVRDFAFYYLLYSKRVLILLSDGSTLPGLDREDILNLAVPLPSYKEQLEIASLINKLYENEFSLIKVINDINLEETSQSILARAFRGELGTNDPTEESALELLKETLAEQQSYL